MRTSLTVSLLFSTLASILPACVSQDDAADALADDSAEFSDGKADGSQNPLPAAGIECTYHTAWIFDAGAESSHEEQIPFFEGSTVRVRPVSATKIEETFTLRGQPALRVLSGIAGGYARYTLAIPVAWRRGKSLDKVSVQNIRRDPHVWGLSLAPFQWEHFPRHKSIYQVEYTCIELPD